MTADLEAGLALLEAACWEAGPAFLGGLEAVKAVRERLAEAEAQRRELAALKQALERLERAEGEREARLRHRRALAERLVEQAQRLAREIG